MGVLRAVRGIEHVLGFLGNEKLLWAMQLFVKLAKAFWAFFSSC
jgi:hypothetical protein